MRGPNWMVWKGARQHEVGLRPVRNVYGQRYGVSLCGMVGMVSTDWVAPPALLPIPRCGNCARISKAREGSRRTR